MIISSDTSTGQLEDRLRELEANLERLAEDGCQQERGSTNLHRNEDGWRDLWKERYWQRKLFKDIDRPIKPRDPKVVKWERQRRERQEAERAEFYHLQQICYQTWLRLKGRPCS